MKKILCGLTALLLAFGLAACKQVQPQPEATQTPAEVAETGSTDQSNRAGASGETPDTSHEATVELTDLMGNTVSVALPAETVVSLSPSTTEILYTLNQQDKILGVDAFSNYPEQARQKEILGDFSGPNVEAIVALQPDVVLAGNGLQQDAVDKLKELGIAVVCVEARAFGEIEASIHLIGKIMGAEDAAQALCTDIQNTRDAVAAEAEALKNHPSAYYVMSYGEAGNWTGGPGSFINDIMETAGFTCVTADGGAPWMDFAVEDLVAAQPDVLLFSSEAGDAQALRAQVGYKELQAVRRGRVYVVDADVVSRPGPRIIDAMQNLLSIAKEASE